MTDTHEPPVKCSAGRERAICCSPRAIDNLRERYGNGWVYHWGEFNDVVAVVADALGIDPHALDDNVQDRGWEYHDTGIERAIVQGAYALLHPEDNDPDGPIIVEARRGTEGPSLYENIAAALAAEEVLDGACCSCPKDHEVVLAVINREIHNWEKP